MPAQSKDRRKVVAQISAITRHHGPDDNRLTDLRRDLRAAELAEHVSRIVEGFPPLTDDQRDKIVGLLRPTSGRGGDQIA